MKRVLFVCTGNICRSPTAEGVALHMIHSGGLGAHVHVDSAGTHGYHVGEAPDPRTLKAAARRGYDLSPLRARKLELRDFQDFDLLLAMDRGHLDLMKRACPEVYRPKLDLFLRYAAKTGFDEVPDPYYGGPQGFEMVLDMCEAGVDGLLDRIGA
ncbi:low molecular weight protein-tyrosine-phosphatase [Azoarcus olearius]|uniref:protein-tyrosine-phosphatase n=1 Tax=Azoarcus sp. (strain BH72) TaxID=418699 RepID=A1K5X4_AZOSB|nr:low molecular weight protein-tyrosine-phosphatase [Azoarcus olearius]CAL94229.1 PtpA protein [Azoarcus olearius]